MGIVIGLIVVGFCFGMGYIMNPKNTTTYNYRESELWEPPVYWKKWSKYGETWKK